MGEDAAKVKDEVFENFCREIECAKMLYFRDSLPHFVPVVEEEAGVKVITGVAKNGARFICAFTSVAHLKSSPLVADVPNYSIVCLRTPKEAMVFWAKLLDTMVKLGTIQPGDGKTCPHSIGITFNFADIDSSSEIVSVCLVCYLAKLVDLVEHTPVPPPLFPEVEEVDEVPEVETFPVDPNKENLET